MASRDQPYMVGLFLEVPRNASHLPRPVGYFTVQGRVLPNILKVLRVPRSRHSHKEEEITFTLVPKSSNALSTCNLPTFTRKTKLPTSSSFLSSTDFFVRRPEYSSPSTSSASCTWLPTMRTHKRSSRFALAGRGWLSVALLHMATVERALYSRILGNFMVSVVLGHHTKSWHSSSIPTSTSTWKMHSFMCNECNKP
ncbi:hypothetical protein M9H77_23252 [Catharanthus roseus]|uniref:Uncharacterized protein n=1 Tax=Catharanthus roseus TaxID=4058 RepID=A0ACC0AUY6_CATRO|nr:hypothetical protein M9H77_23252 [Catharanthus roseus]